MKGYAQMTDWKTEHDAELGLRREFSARAEKAEAELRAAAEEIERLRDVLTEARLQIEYLHEKFQTTSTGVAVLARIAASLTGRLGQE
jgi:chromosome segregation ATPase